MPESTVSNAFFHAVQQFLDAQPERKFQEYWIFRFFQPLQDTLFREGCYAGLGLPLPRGNPYYTSTFTLTLLALYGEILGPGQLVPLLASLYCRHSRNGKPTIGEGVGALRGFMSGQYPQSPERIHVQLREAETLAENAIRESEVVDDGRSLRLYRHTPSSPESAALQDALDLMPSTEYGRRCGNAWFQAHGFPETPEILAQWVQRPLSYALRTPGGEAAQLRLKRTFSAP